MMNQATASPWIDGDAARRGGWAALMLAGITGLLLGSALTTFAADGRSAAMPAAVEREWRHPALDREWRGYATPVNPDRMFRQRR